MQWSVKPKKELLPLPEPKPGDYRIVKRFALFPVLCENNVKVWWQTYYVEQKYMESGDSYHGFSREWITMHKSHVMLFDSSHGYYSVPEK